MSHEVTALQQVRMELQKLGVANVTNSPAYAAIRWLLAETTYVKLQESSSSMGTALQNQRREAAHWKERFEATSSTVEEKTDGS